MKYDGQYLHIEYLLGMTMKVQALAVEAHKYDVYLLSFQNIIFNVCVFVEEDSMILKKYIYISI